MSRRTEFGGEECRIYEEVRSRVSGGDVLNNLVRSFAPGYYCLVTYDAASRYRVYVASENKAIALALLGFDGTSVELDDLLRGDLSIGQPLTLHLHLHGVNAILWRQSCTFVVKTQQLVPSLRANPVV